MRHGSLESGIGGFEIAAEAMGWENVFHCEINKFGQRVLKFYWPDAESYEDIFDFDGTLWRGRVDIITCGFPCQPYSLAGKRKGSKDDRALWPENIRIIGEAKPSFVLAENVPGILTIENGVVFERVCLDLEAEGYEVTPLIIPACATDKVHRRDRVWIIANNKSNHEWNARLLKGGLQKQIRGCGSNGAPSHSECEGLERKSLRCPQSIQSAAGAKENRNVANPNNERLERYRGNGERGGKRITWEGDKKETWLEAATRLCGVDDGLSGRLDTAAISKGKWRTESLKAYGNAIVWDVAYEIFKAIESMKAE